MGDVFGEYAFAVRTYECGADGRAALHTVCNYLQEAASLNAGELKFSRTDFAAAGAGVTWVLTRLRASLARRPAWGETVTVRTWPRAGRRIAAYRDFVLLDAAGGEIGRAASEWMLIDLATRRVSPVPASVFAAANDVRPPVLGDSPFSRLRWTCAETAGAARFRAGRADIDLNGHVNNARYVAWLMETAPAGAGECVDLEIAFHSETLAGEEVLAEAVEVEPSVWAHRLSAPGGRDRVLARTVWRA